MVLLGGLHCTPVVYSKANSFGLPCLSTNVSGIASIVKDDINSKFFSLALSGDVMLFIFKALLPAIICMNNCAILLSTDMKKGSIGRLLAKN
jgi:hypothetical protein